MADEHGRAARVAEHGEQVAGDAGAAPGGQPTLDSPQLEAVGWRPPHTLG